MIRISKETDYGIVLLTCLAQAADGSLSASALAERGILVRHRRSAAGSVRVLHDASSASNRRRSRAFPRS